MYKMMNRWIRALFVYVIRISLLAIISGLLAEQASAINGEAEFEKPMTLEDCISAALENSPDIAMARWDERASQARLAQAKGSMLPSLGLEGAYSRYGKAQRVIPPRAPGESGAFDEQVVDYGIAARMPLFRGGKGINALRIAQFEQLAATEETIHSRDLVVFGVTEVFYKIVGLDSLIAATRFSRQSLEAHRKQIQENISVGKATRLDLLKMEVRIAELDQSLIKLENDRNIAVCLLLYRAGYERSLESAFRVIPDLSPRDSPLTQEEAVKQALVSRSDYRAGQLRLRSQQKRLSIASGGRWPEMILNGRYGGRSGGNIEFDNDWNVGIRVDVPLFAGGTLSAQSKGEFYKLRRMEAAQRKLKMAVELEVKAAYVRLQEAQERLQTADVVVEHAREVLRIEQEIYRLGKGTLADLLDAQAESLRGKASEVEALVDQAIAVAELKKAMGVLCEPSNVEEEVQ